MQRHVQERRKAESAERSERNVAGGVLHLSGGQRHHFESLEGNGFYSRDAPFSAKIRALGLLIAWPDRELAINVGHQPAEFARDPDYYIRNYRLKLFTRARLGNLLRQLAQGRFAETRQTRLLLGRLLKIRLLKLRQQPRRQPPRDSA